MIVASRFLNDGSTNSPGTPVFLNLDTFVDHPRFDVQDESGRRACLEGLQANGFEGVQFTDNFRLDSGCMQVPIDPDLSARPRQAHGVADYLAHFKDLWTCAMQPRFARGNTSRQKGRTVRAIALSACLACFGGALSPCTGQGKTAESAGTLHITHEFANVDARSMIGLPMGNHKTIVTKDGQLKWSQWSLAQKGRAVLFGFSEQLDGALGIQMREMHESNGDALVAAGQHLDQMHFPFIVTEWQGRVLSVRETAFAVSTGSKGLDVV